MQITQINSCSPVSLRIFLHVQYPFPKVIFITYRDSWRNNPAAQELLDQCRARSSMKNITG